MTTPTAHPDAAHEERVRAEFMACLAAGRRGDVDAAGAHWAAFVALIGARSGDERERMK